MQNSEMKKDKHRLVFGLGGGFCYSLKNYREDLPKLVNAFDNDILISTVDIPFTIAELLYDTVGGDRLYLDSGGFTLFKDQMKLGADNPQFHNQCEKMKTKFLKLLARIKPKQCFELDNDHFLVEPDDLLSPKNFLRQEIFEITGSYPCPVYKMHQGFEYWKALCEDPRYPKLAIGGLAQTRSWNTRTEEIKVMMDYARECGKQVHLLGCQNVQAFKEIQPDTVDYSIFQMAINLEVAKSEFLGTTDKKVLKESQVEYRDISPHISLYATARAMARSFLYDSYRKE